MILHRIEFVLREMAIALGRHPLMAFAAVGSAAAALAIVGGAALVWLNLNVWGEQMLSEVRVTAYLRHHLPRAQAMAICREVRGWPEVKSASFVTKEDMLKRFQERLEADSSLLELSPNPLSDAVEVEAVDARQVPALHRELEAKPSVETVMSAQSTVKTLLTLRRAVRLVGLVGGGLLVLASLAIIYNTIHLTLFARRREITIMQMVGATDRFVAAPFVLEGVVHGLVGAALACAVLVPGYLALAHALTDMLPFFRLIPEHRLVDVAIALVAGGAVVGAGASMLSVRRFLRREHIM